ncbi:hypothetical protein LSTR_LSTR007657 [Laodelphax striatellus]|uniref:RBR-type E3 ubiquitin transferase n=1 Tax=Laodelphax striatellus TaxID=195883 RepID=A0A482WJ81_LAOST|nr:hypothetical protein LSTR_LSTR007657 [Laodelphax striatellus]
MGSASSKFKKYIQHGDEFAAMQIYQSSPELRKSLDPNLSYGENHQHNTALHYAAKHGMKHLLRTFLNDHGGNPNKKNGKNETVLHAACQVGARKTFSSQERRAACVALLLQWRGSQLSSGHCEKVQVDAQDSNGNSALHAAAHSGLQRCVELLLAAGAPLFLENNDKMTPCDTAVKSENHAIARFLESRMVFADDSSSDTVNEMELYGCNESEADEVYSGLRTQDLQEAKDQLLVETSDMLNIPLFTAEALLRDNEWSRECLLEKWIRDAVKCCQVAGVKPPPSAYQTTATAAAAAAVAADNRFQDQPNHQQINEQDKLVDFIECEICFSEIAKRDWPTITMTCDHQFCSTCWECYLTGKIQEGGEHRILCPAHHCHILVPSELIEQLVPPNIARRYLQFDIKAFVETNRSIKWCPMAGCGRAVRLPETEHNRASEMRTSHAVDCGNGHFFCWECLGEAHAPCACSEWQKWLSKISEVRPEELSSSSRSEHEDAANCLWLVTNCKPCPNCQSPIQKSEGCNHIKCSKCKYDFCWVCLESWKRHNSTTGGYFRCNRFEAVHKADEKQGVLISEAMVRNQQTTELNRFLHYYTRFRNHENSRRLEEPLLTGIRLKMEALASTRSKKGDIECTKFVEEGVRELLKARRILCGSYVHGYYLEDNGYSRTIFEFMQNELEEATEKLSEMVARPYLRTPKGVIVQGTALARRKRHEFARAVSKGLVPPPPPPPLQPQVEDEGGGWVKDAQGKHNNLSATATLYAIQQLDSEEESEVNRALAVSVLGECAKVGCSRPRAYHAFCSQRCSKIAAAAAGQLDSYQVNVTSDYNMDLVIALEMSRLQMIEDEMKQKQREECNGTGLDSKSTSNSNEPSTRRDDELNLADQTISERPQMPLPQDIGQDTKSCKFGASSSLGSYQKSSADLAVDYFLKSLARNMEVDSEEGATQRSASVWEKKRSIDKDNMWKPCCAVAEDGRFEISEIHETGLYNDRDEFDGDGDSRSLKRSHSTGDLVMKRGRLATRAADEPRYHLDSDHSSQHDDRPEDLSRRILAVAGTNRHSLTLQSSAGSTTQYGGQSSLEDTTTSDSLNADLEVCGILGSSIGDDDKSSMQNVIHLATLPRNLATIGKKSALDLGDADNRQSLSLSESSDLGPAMSTSKSLTNVCLRSRLRSDDAICEERPPKAMSSHQNAPDQTQSKSSINFQKTKKDVLSVKRKESPSPPTPTLHTAFYQPSSCAKFTFDQPLQSPSLFNYSSPVSEINPDSKTSLVSSNADSHLSESEFNSHHTDTCKVKSGQMSSVHDFRPTALSGCMINTPKSDDTFPLLTIKPDVHNKSNRISPVLLQPVGNKYALLSDLTISSPTAETKAKQGGENQLKSLINESSRYSESAASPSYVINPLTLSPPNCRSTDSKKPKPSYGHQFHETGSSNSNESDVTDLESLNIISPAGSWNNIDDSIPEECLKDIKMNRPIQPERTENTFNRKLEKNSLLLDHNISNDQLKKCSTSKEDVCINDKGNDKTELFERPVKSRNLLRASSSSSLLVSNICGASNNSTIDFSRKDRKSDGCLKMNDGFSTIFDKSSDGKRTMFTSKDPSFKLKLLDTNNPRKVPRSFFKRSSMPSEYMSAAIASSLNVTDNRQSKSSLTLNEAVGSGQKPKLGRNAAAAHGLRITISSKLHSDDDDDDDDEDHFNEGACKKVLCLETDSSNEYESETGIPKSPTLFISGVSISRTPEPKSPGRQSRSSSLTVPATPPLPLPGLLRANPFMAARNNSQSLTAALGLSFRRRIQPQPTPTDRTLITSSTPAALYSTSFYQQGGSSFTNVEGKSDKKLFNISSCEIDPKESSGNRTSGSDLSGMNSISSTPPSPRAPTVENTSSPPGGLVKSSTDGALSSVLHVREGSLGSDDFHEALFLLERSRSPNANTNSKRRKRTKRGANANTNDQMEASSAL